MTVNISKPALNVREKLAELDKPTGIAGEAMLRAETVAEQQALIGVGRRNLIINGAMQVAQRGTSASGTTGFYSLDRWRGYSGNSFTISQETFTLGQTDVPNEPKNYLRVGTGANAKALSQRIEGVRAGAGQTLTLSFYAKASSAFSLSLGYTQAFGSGGSPASGSEFETVSVTTSWQKFEVTFSLPSISGKTIGSGDFVQFDFGYGAPYIPAATTFDITQVQLELGKVATPFEHRSYGEELALCQRYYQRLTAATNNAAICTTSLWTGGTSCYGVLHLPTELRTAPTVSFSGTFVVFSGGSTTNVTSSGGGSNFNGNSVELVFNHSAIGSAGDSAWIRMGSTGNYVGLDAEL